MEKPTCQTQT